jgi:hypothetical protein
MCQNRTFRLYSSEGTIAVAEHQDREVTVIQFCREYLEALERLVQGFRQ